MKVTVYGAGAIGGWIGARLARVGYDVSFVARGKTLEALNRDGLLLIEGDKSSTLRVRLSDSPHALGTQDLVIVAVKAPSMGSVATSIAPLLGPDTAVLTAMNGVPWWFCAGLGPRFANVRLNSVDPTGEIASSITAQQTVGCVVHASCTQLNPGKIKHHMGNRLIVGEAVGPSKERTGRIAQAFQTAGFDVETSEHIQRDIWFKLWGNMTMNPISAITGATTDHVLEDELVRTFATRIMEEAARIGQEIGIPIEQDSEERHGVTAKLGAMRTSMLQDVLARRPVEIDALVSSVRELGQITGVATPYTDVLLGLSRLHASTLGLY